VISLTEGGEIASRISALGISVISLGMAKGIPDPRGFVRLHHHLQQIKPDILQTWLYHADLLGTLVAKSVKVDHLLWNLRCSDMRPEYYRGLKKLMMLGLSRLSHFPDAIIYNSHAGRNIHEQAGYAPRQWSFIPNGINLSIYEPSKDARRSLRQELSLDDSSFLIGMIARYDPIKDHATMLKAAALVANDDPNARFLLVGTGVDTANCDLMGQIRELGLSKKIHLLGHRRDIPRITAGLDLATLTSQGEGFPNVVAEAMACGIPFVATDVGDTRLIIGENGVVVPPRDPPALAKAWKCIASMSSDARLRLGKAARNRIAENFQIETTTGGYEALYHSLKPSKSSFNSQ